jgi:hypothetical protein
MAAEIQGNGWVDELIHSQMDAWIEIVALFQHQSNSGADLGCESIVQSKELQA